MMKVFILFDSFLLLHIFQPIADTLERWTGRSCFFFSAQLIAIAIASYLIHVIYGMDFRSKFTGTNGASLVASLLMIWIWQRVYRDAIRWQERVESGQLPYGMNPNVIRYWGFRLGFAFLSFLLNPIMLLVFILNSDVRLTTLWSMMEDMALVSALYLLCCNPRPPLRRATPVLNPI